MNDLTLVGSLGSLIIGLLGVLAGVFEAVLKHRQDVKNNDTQSRVELESAYTEHIPELWSRIDKQSQIIDGLNEKIKKQSHTISAQSETIAKQTHDITEQKIIIQHQSAVIDELNQKIDRLTNLMEEARK